MVSEIQRTIAEQITAKELVFAKFKLLTSDENTLVVRKASKYLRIEYDYSADTYTTTRGKIVKFESKEEEPVTGRFWEDLKPEICDYFKFEYVMHMFARA